MRLSGFLLIAAALASCVTSQCPFVKATEPQCMMITHTKGRLGNQLGFYANAVGLAVDFNWSCVSYPQIDSKIIAPTVALAGVDCAEICSGSKPKITVAAKALHHFRLGCATNDTNLNSIKAQQLLSRASRVPYPPKALPGTLHIWMRATATLHPKYIQAPCSFYDSVLNLLNWTSVIVVTGNPTNPCIATVQERVGERFSFKVRTLMEDLADLMSARTLVFGGVTTFMPMLNRLSFFSQADSIFEWDQRSPTSIGYFKKMGEWHNQDWQLEFMKTSQAADFVQYQPTRINSFGQGGR